VLWFIQAYSLRAGFVVHGAQVGVGFSMSDIPRDHRKPSLDIKLFALQAPCVSIDSATHPKVNRIPNLFVDQLIHRNSVGGLSKRGCIFYDTKAAASTVGIIDHYETVFSIVQLGQSIAFYCPLRTPRLTGKTRFPQSTHAYASWG